MGSARVRSAVAMVATHCVDDHSSDTRDCLSRSDYALLCKITRRLWHTRTGRAALSESLAFARRMDTLLGFRLISGRVAGTAACAFYDIRVKPGAGVSADELSAAKLISIQFTTPDLLN